MIAAAISVRMERRAPRAPKGAPAEAPNRRPSQQMTRQHHLRPRAAQVMICNWRKDRRVTRAVARGLHDQPLQLQTLSPRSAQLRMQARLRAACAAGKATTRPGQLWRCRASQCLGRQGARATAKRADAKERSTRGPGPRPSGRASQTRASMIPSRSPRARARTACAHSARGESAGRVPSGAARGAVLSTTTWHVRAALARSLIQELAAKRILRQRARPW